MKMTALFTLKIANQRGATLGFLFNDEQSCGRYYTALSDAMRGVDFAEERGLAAEASKTKIEVRDSYGNLATVDTTKVDWIWMTDLGRDLEGQKDVQMLQMHAQANLQRRVAADPLLRAAPPPGNGAPPLIRPRDN